MLDEYAQQADGSEPLLSAKEAAAFLGRTSGTLANYRSLGKGPVYQIVDGCALYRRSDLETWLDETSTDGLLDTAEAAKLAGCSPKTLSNHRSYGTGPAFVRLKGLRGTRCVFYRPEDVTAWMEARS